MPLDNIPISIYSYATLLTEGRLPETFGWRSGSGRRAGDAALAPVVRRRAIPGLRTGAAPAGAGKRSLRTRAAPGLRLGVLRPPARSWLTDGRLTHKRSRGPGRKARPGAVRRTPRGAPGGAASGPSSPERERPESAFPAEATPPRGPRPQAPPGAPPLACRGGRKARMDEGLPGADSNNTGDDVWLFEIRIGATSTSPACGERSDCMRGRACNPGEGDSPRVGALGESPSPGIDAQAHRFRPLPTSGER